MIRRSLTAAAAVALSAAVAALAPAIAAASIAHQPAPPSTAASVTLLGAAPVAPIPSGFLGLSVEYQSIFAMAGEAGNTDTVFEQLIRNLAPGQQPVLRIGGDSTDHTWYPAPGLRSSPSFFYTITPQWLRSVAALAAGVSAQLILGINLEADRPKVARAEADALMTAVGRSHVLAFEIGNEPDVYHALTWYTASNGKNILGRGPAYGFLDYAEEVQRIASVLPAASLAGPALGQTEWMPALPWLMDVFPALQLVTYHLYPLDRCWTSPGDPTYPTIANLLSPASTTGLAAQIQPYAATATGDGRAFRVDELNSVACAGQVGVSNTFASALWVLDTLFALVQNGAGGVNVHTFPTAAYSLFNFSDAGGHWTGTVAPEYYGMLMFEQAAPVGSQLLQMHATADPQLQAWATRTSAGTTNVVLINDSSTTAAQVAVRAPSAATTAQLELLQAPSLASTSGVTLGGTEFASPTRTGLLAATPQVQPVTSAGGTYAVSVAAGSAALLTVPPAGGGASPSGRR